jgi:hypothetical protein
VQVNNFAWAKSGNDIAKTFVSCLESDSTMAMQTLPCDPASATLTNGAASNLGSIATPDSLAGVIFIQYKK